MAFPTTSVLSSFTGADEDPLSEGGAWGGQIQSGSIGNLRRLSNQAAPSSSAGTSQSYWATSVGADQEAYATVATKPADGDYVAVWLRAQNPGSGTAVGYQCVMIAADGTDKFQVWRMSSGGSYTQVTDGTLDATQEFSSGDSFGASIDGTTITLWHKPSAGSWTQVGQGNDSNISGDGYIGLDASHAGASTRLDDFGGGAISSGPSAPSFVGAGSGDVWQSGAARAVTKSGVTVGNLLILQVLDDGNDDATISSISGIEDLGGTGSAMTSIIDHTFSTALHGQLWVGRATSTSVSVSVAGGTSGVDTYSRLYEFADVNTGTALTDILENGSAGSTGTPTTATSTTIADSGVTTLGDNRLALQFVFVNDDNALDAFTGQTGGDWTEAVAEYLTATGTDAAIGLQIATVASAGTIDGGTDAMAASDRWGVIGFALLPVSSRKAQAAAAAETDTAVAAGRVKKKPIGIAVDTPAAISITRAHRRTVGIATETDSNPTALGKLKTRAAGVAAETDTAIGVARVKTKAAGQAAETDSAIAVARRKARTAAIATETDAALSLNRVRSRLLGIATETDLAQALARTKIRAIAAALETDTALTITRAASGQVGIAIDTSAALPIARVKTRAAAAATEADTAIAATRRKAKVAAEAAETDAGVAVTRTHRRTVGVASETDATQPIAHTKTRAVAVAIDAQTAVPLVRRKLKAIAAAVQTETAIALLRLKNRTLGPADETDVAVALLRAHRKAAGTALEGDVALTIAAIIGQLTVHAGYATITVSGGGTTGTSVQGDAILHTGVMGGAVVARSVAGDGAATTGVAGGAEATTAVG